MKNTFNNTIAPTIPPIPIKNCNVRGQNIIFPIIRVNQLGVDFYGQSKQIVYLIFFAFPEALAERSSNIRVHELPSTAGADSSGEVERSKSRV